MSKRFKTCIGQHPSVTNHLIDRVVASHVLLMAYCRQWKMCCMITRKVPGMFNSGPCKYHKGNKSAAKKSLLLPIVGSSAGVGAPSWVQCWWETRKLAQLPIEGKLNGPLIPASSPHHDDQWSARRPLTLDID